MIRSVATAMKVLLPQPAIMAQSGATGRSVGKSKILGRNDVYMSDTRLDKYQRTRHIYYSVNLFVLQTFLDSGEF